VKYAFKAIFLTSILSILGANYSFGDQIAVSNFKGGINANNNPLTINNDTAQDLLNVDVTPGGLSVKKRDGYGLYKALSTTQAMHGGFHAFDSTGNDYQIWGSSRSLFSIVADGTPTTLVSSATLNSTWDCADTQGYTYCVNSNRDMYLRTDGVTKSWYTSPLGTMVEVTPDRVVVAGVSGTPNTLYVSQSNTFTNFVTGVNDTDAFTEVIASQGSKLTHIRWACGKLLWWKDQSFGYFDFDNQYTAQVKTVSDTIGTFDNTSAVDPGGRVWFRGQDGHTWVYDCSSLSKESVDITPYVQVSGKRTANLWTQTTQSDFESGRINPSGTLSTTINVGSVVVSSYSSTDTGSSDFNQGSGVNVIIGTNDVRISTNNAGTITDPDFEGTLATNYSADATAGASNAVFDNSEVYTGNCTLNPQSGSKFLRMKAGGSSVSSCNEALYVNILDQNDVYLSTRTLSVSEKSCSWTSDSYVDSSLIGKRVKFQFKQYYDNCLSGGLLSTYEIRLKTISSYIFSGILDYYFTCEVDSAPGTYTACSFDNVSAGSSTITAGSFTSRVFDTALSTSVAQVQASWTANDSTPIFIVQHSTSTLGQWFTLMTSSGTNAQANRYLRYVSSFTVSGTDDALTTLNDATVVARSSGSYFSSVKNAPNLNAWSTFSAGQSLNDGTETFYIRSSTSVFTVLSSTPSWVLQTVGGLVSASTGTYIQVRDDFAITAATQTPTLNDFTINWFEGSATDQAYMTYFDNSIWQSVAYGSGQSVNNYIFKRDLINDSWTFYNFGAGGMLVQANTLYFGDTTAGNVFNYGTTTSDNGTAIQSYWKSKEFSGTDPFLQTQLTNIDTIAKRDQGSTLTATYAVETSTETSYSIGLSSTTNSIIQSRKLLPSGKLGYTFSIKYGDTSTSSAWEFMGFRIGFTQNPYRPQN